MSGVGDEDGAVRLRDVALPSGEKPIAEDDKDQDINSAAAALGQLSEKMGHLILQSKQGHENAHAVAGALESGHLPGASVPAGVAASGPASWGLWHWLTYLGSNIKKWSISAWNFVVETTKGVFRFVLKTVGHVMKAITFGFEQIGVGFKKLGQFLAFLFDWDDILDMRTVLSNVLNTCIDSLGSALDIFVMLQ